MAINAYPSKAHGFSPFLALTGREMAVPSKFTQAWPEERHTVPNSVRLLQQRGERIFSYIGERSGAEMAKAKKYYDEKVKTDEIEVGEKVLYRLFNSGKDKRALVPKYKLEKYVVIKKRGVNYLIRPENENDEKKDVKVNRDQIKRAVNNDPNSEIEIERREAAENARRRIGILANWEMNDQIE